MATIRSQMVLNDQVTGVLKNITRALDITLHSFEQMQDASANAVDVRLLNQARAGLGEVNLAVREMEENYRRAAQQEQQVTRNIRQSTQAEQQLNASIRGGNDALDDMVGKAKNLAATIGASVGLKKLIELSDQMTSTTARLNFIVDDGGSVKALEAKIMASAQRSRAAYLDTASAIASMGANAGAAFTSNDELIAFMEQVNKQFVIGGASAQGQAAAMLQLTQAMAAGALRGEELNSILENAPGIARAIEQYMGIAEGSIKSYAEKGAVSATVVKNALLSIADETNAKFNGMAMTWGQVWTQMGNIALKVTQPLLTAINWLANNLSVIGPILLGLGTAFLVFQVAAHWTQIAAVATAAYHAVVNLLSIGFGVLTGNTAAASAAVFTFNSALLASPITWIIMLIAVLYDNVGKLTLKSLGNMKLNMLVDEDTAGDYDYKSSIATQTYDKIKLSYENKETGKREIYIAQDGSHINQWGVLQYYEKLDSKANAKAMADALLDLYNTKTRTLKLQDVLGDIRVRAGTLLVVMLGLGDINVSNYLMPKMYL